MILSKKYNNTKEYQDDKGNITVTLHGHQIVFKTDKSVYINMCGYNTVTTKCRINEVFKDLGFTFKLHNIGSRPHINNIPCDCINDWVEVYRYED